MGKVSLHVVMSLDGSISKRDAMDYAWMFTYGSDEDERAPRTMHEIGAVVLGNQGFRDGPRSEEHLPYGGIPLPPFVVTQHAREPVTIGPLTVTFVSGGVAHAIALAKDAAGANAVVRLSASTAQQGRQAGLGDELVIHLVPLLLGDGMLLCDQRGQEIELRREEMMTTSQETSLRFRVGPTAQEGGAVGWGGRPPWRSNRPSASGSTPPVAAVPFRSTALSPT